MEGGRRSQVQDCTYLRGSEQDVVLTSSRTPTYEHLDASSVFPPPAGTEQALSPGLPRRADTSPWPSLSMLLPRGSIPNQEKNVCFGRKSQSCDRILVPAPPGCDAHHGHCESIFPSPPTWATVGFQTLLLQSSHREHRPKPVNECYSLDRTWSPWVKLDLKLRSSLDLSVT